MTRTLFDLTYHIALALGGVHHGTAIDGSVVTIQDTLTLTQPDNYWGGAGGNGTVWILYDDGGAGAAPEGEFARVTAFVQSTSTLTFATLTAAVQLDDRYAVASPRYSFEQLIEVANQALQTWGGIAQEDTTSLDTAPSTIEYTLPLADMDLREVWVRYPVSDPTVTPPYWVRLHDWYVEKNATGSASTLVFENQPLENRDLRLVYVAPHPRLNVAGDQLDEQVPFETIVSMAAMLALEARLMAVNDKDPLLRQQLDKMRERYAQQRTDSPRRNPPRKPRQFIIEGMT